MQVNASFSTSDTPLPATAVSAASENADVSFFNFFRSSEQRNPLTGAVVKIGEATYRVDPDKESTRPERADNVPSEPQESDKEKKHKSGESVPFGIPSSISVMLTPVAPKWRQELPSHLSHIVVETVRSIQQMSDGQKISSVRFSIPNESLEIRFDLTASGLKVVLSSDDPQLLKELEIYRGSITTILKKELDIRFEDIELEPRRRGSDSGQSDSGSGRQDQPKGNHSK
ncbi:hypothetical protein EBR96_05470 [bacterium]|nr:hypothetical protein [bacterium]